MALGSRMSKLNPHARLVPEAKRPPRKPISLTTWIFLALALGIGTGLFIGEYANNLKFIGDIYVGLMQMTVLPYVVFSLIGNIGRLSVREVGLLATSGLKIFLG
ncbi:MAG: hypothetical protein RLZZ09_1172, partial [Pseudomonadota bacterium]